MDPRFEELGFRDGYGAYERYLHMMIFYEGIISPDLLRREVVKVRKYIEDVENLIKI